MMKTTFLVLLAVGCSLATPVEDQAKTEVTTQASNVTQTPEVPQQPPLPDYPEEVEPEMYPDGECPEVDSDFPVYLSDMKNCSVFYQCANGVPYRMSCSYPLEFNPTLKVCDFPGLSGCTYDKIAPYTMIGRCPPYATFNKLLRDSEDNTIYYECVNGTPILRQCPEGTIFNFKRTCVPAA